MRDNLSKLLGEHLSKVSDIHEFTRTSKKTLTNLYYQRATNVQLEILQKIYDYLQVSLSELVEYKSKVKEV